SRKRPCRRLAKRTRIDLPVTLPLPARLFMVWLTLLLWKREADSAAGLLEDRSSCCCKASTFGLKSQVYCHAHDDQPRYTLVEERNRLSDAGRLRRYSLLHGLAGLLCNVTSLLCSIAGCICSLLGSCRCALGCPFGGMCG